MKTVTKNKVGRPPVGTRAMTSAERQSRYRERIRREAHEMLQRLKEAQHDNN